MLVFLAPCRVAKCVRSAATNPFSALLAAMSSIAKNPAHKRWKLLKNMPIGNLTNKTRMVQDSTFQARRAWYLEHFIEVTP